MHTEHDAPNTDVNPESIKAGHEADVVHVRTILYVPVALVITFALCYGVVTLIVNYMRSPSRNPAGTSLAANYNRTAVQQDELNKQLDRISSTDPKADVRAPRLEGLDTLSSKVAPYVESSVPTKEGNSPHYHPEDLRAGSKKADGSYRWPELQEYSWKDKEKSLVRIPIGEALKILGEGAQDKDSEAKKLYQKVLKYEDKVNPDSIRANEPKPSNPFWGIKTSTEPKEAPKGGGH
jgi:hypothetical protein